MTAQVMDRIAVADVLADAGAQSAVLPTAAPGRIVARPRQATERPIAAAVGPQVRCARSERPSGYMMSRWQRLAMTIIATAALVVGIAVSVTGQSIPVGGQVIAQPGDTVGSIVLRELPGADPLRAMELVESLNGLTDGSVVSGATVLLPALP